jgi:hypothetical protein
MSTEFTIVTPQGHAFRFNIPAGPTSPAQAFLLSPIGTWDLCLTGQTPSDLRLTIECYMSSWFGTPPPQGPLERAELNTREMYKRIGPRPL